MVEGLSRRSAKYCLHRPYPVCGTRYVWLEYCWLFMIPVWWQVLVNISSLASSTPSVRCAGPVIHSDTNLHKIYICHRQLLLMGTDLICGRHQLSHQIHHIFFPLSQKIDSTSSPVIGEGVNVPVLLWPNGVPQVMYRNPSPVLAWSHAIHSWCWSVSRRADIIMTDCYTNNVSVTSFCHQDSLRASSFCRMIVRPRCTKIIMSASSYRVQRANSSKPIMWLLLKSFDINDHILSLFLRKMRQLDRILHLFDTLHLTNVLA